MCPTNPGLEVEFSGGRMAAEEPGGKAVLFLYAQVRSANGKQAPPPPPPAAAAAATRSPPAGKAAAAAAAAGRAALKRQQQPQATSPAAAGPTNTAAAAASPSPSSEATCLLDAPSTWEPPTPAAKRPRGVTTGISGDGKGSGSRDGGGSRAAAAEPDVLQMV